MPEIKATSFTRPNWAEISLDALCHNYRVIARHVAPAAVCAVIKCDAYGHGVVPCGKALVEREGASWLGVTSVEEGMLLRQAGITANVLIMTGFWRGEEDAVIAARLTPAIWTPEQVELLERAALGKNSGPTKVPVHLKADTGMGRLGPLFEDLDALVRRIARAPVVEVEGVFSHFASSEVLGAADVAAQIARFGQALEILRVAGLEPPYRHLANTAAIVGRPNTWNNMVRPGLVLYGYNVPYTFSAKKENSQAVESGSPANVPSFAGVEYPDETDIPEPLPVIPVLSWKTRIISLRQLPAGQAVGYNGTYVTRAPSRIAVIAVGYGDGFVRLMSNKARVIVRGRYAPQVGNISMDLTTIDVTGIDGVEVGDEVVLIGRQGDLTVTAEDHARWAGTIPYEITCGIAPRVPRVY